MPPGFQKPLAIVAFAETMAALRQEMAAVALPLANETTPPSLGPDGVKGDGLEVG